jgi:hypothetical protein
MRKMEGGFFYITYIHRDDLKGSFSDEEIATLTDSDMEEIADKMADAYLEMGFWETLEDATEIILQRK